MSLFFPLPACADDEGSDALQQYKAANPNVIANTITCRSTAAVRTAANEAEAVICSIPQKRRNRMLAGSARLSQATGCPPFSEREMRSSRLRR